MSKNVAVIGVGGTVIAINVQPDDHEIQPYEVLVTNAAWVGGDYVNGYFYPSQPYPSWTRHEGNWQPPVPYPADGVHTWDEDEQTWQPLDLDPVA